VTAAGRHSMPRPRLIPRLRWKKSVRSITKTKEGGGSTALPLFILDSVYEGAALLLAARVVRFASGTLPCVAAAAQQARRDPEPPSPHTQAGFPSTTLQIAASDDHGGLLMVKHAAQPIRQGCVTACHSYDYEHECGDPKCGFYHHTTSLVATPQTFCLKCDG
jgi:hypothetical protein